MRRFYQESWQGIPFTKFSHLSFFHLAEPRFYSIFYEELFRRYKTWSDLPEVWRFTKTRDTEWLKGRIEELRNKEADKERPFRVLSIGTGIGYMEKLLIEELPDVELHVNEPSTVGLRWLREFLPPERLYVGVPLVCLPSHIKWDLIYLSAVDYSIPLPELRRLLEGLRTQLQEGGELICISSSLLEEFSFIGGLVNSMKIVIRMFLHYLAIRKQQFWGWRRTREEYRSIFKSAGLKDIRDGFLQDGVDNYWISGTNLK